MKYKWYLPSIAKRYNVAYPNRPQLTCSNGWIVGSFNIGNDYRNKTKYYGAYPGDLLKRYYVMFNLPNERLNVLHLFSGSIPKGPYTRVDILQECDVPGDCEKLEDVLEDSNYNLIFADPPYTKKDAEQYSTGMPNRLKVMRSAYKIAMPGALLVWLDIIKPMYRKTEWKQVGLIGLERSTNHRIRGIWIFECQSKSQDTEDYF